MKNRSVFDELLKGLGDAVTDIREKVVEEPWYGRVVNERDGQAEPLAEWPQAQEAQPELGSHTHYRESDIDMDR
jgi:hypothetical protein